MLSAKRKRIIIYATTIAVLTSSGGFNLYRERVNDYAEYISNFSEEIKDDDFLVSAHRGFSSLEVENTKEAISLAADKRYVDFIEIDARMTRDGKIVLSHNNSILLKTEERRNVSSMSYDQAINADLIYLNFPFKNLSWFDYEKLMMFDRSFQLNNRKYHLCGLREGLECCGNKKVLLDLKFDYDIVQFTEELKKELSDVDTSNIIFQSLSIPGIRYLKENSNFDCQVLIGSSKDFPVIDYFDRVGLKYDLVNHDLIRRLVYDGKKISIWTINSSSVLERVLKEVGEYYKDIIYITDVPDLIVTRLHEKQKVLTKG